MKFFTQLSLFILLLKLIYSDANSRTENVCPSQPNQLIHTEGIFWLDGSAEIEKNVYVFLSPSMFESYYYTLKDFPDILKNRQFDKSKPTAIYIHGWRDSGEKDNSVLAIRGAYRDRNDHNIITIDWSYYSKNNWYPRVVHQLGYICELVAEKLLEFLNNGYSVDKIHLVGHSLGAQCSGLVGRHLKELSSGRIVIPRIYALDPAGPAFEFVQWIVPLGGFKSISKTDAKYVQIIHTCSSKYGIENAVGTVDFYPNGGSQQFGCNSLEWSCQHARAWYFYQESVRNPNAFPAVMCRSYDDFLNDNCGRTIANMGFNSNAEKSGKFYLKTHSNMFHASLGMDGIKNKKLKVISLDGSFKDVEPFLIKPKNESKNLILDEIIESTF